LLILDVALIAAAIYAGVRVRGQMQAAKARQDAFLSRRVAPPASPPLPALPSVPPVLPVDYADIAQKMLLDKSRNSTVVIETPPAPPPEPVPPLPFYHGQMRLPGEGPIVILSETTGAQHQAVHPGETIGPFKLVEANSQQLAFEWKDKIIRKNLDELLDRSGAASAASVAAANARHAATPPPSVPKSQLGPGVDLNPDVKACVSNDSYGDGAEVGGYRKSMTPSPFGVACQWVKVK
jgi:hypothetical protein